MKTITPSTIFNFQLRDTDLQESVRANKVLRAKPISRELYEDLMDIKNSRAQLNQERRPLFFFIGLSVSLLLVILVFNWKTYNREMVDLGTLDQSFEEILDVPLSTQQPPPPPMKKLEVFTLKEAADQVVVEEIKISLDVEITENMAVEETIYEDFGEEMEEEKVEEIFLIVEDQANFPGGISEFYKYVAQNIVYPEGAMRLNVSGRVFVKFVVERDGSLTQVTVIKGIGAGCDEEAARVLENSPKWNPAKQRGRTVRQWLTLPINFVLREGR
ncbi:MAG: energy transducer TonB [Marinoscillum sp.]